MLLWKQNTQSIYVWENLRCTIFSIFFLFHPSLSGYNIPKAAKYKKKKKEICEQAMHECIAIALYNGGIGHSYTITI